MTDENLICIRCKQPVIKNKEHYETFEKMHWICFHLEYEHHADPDEPCEDPSCPWKKIETYEKKLQGLGIDIEGLI